MPPIDYVEVLRQEFTEYAEMLLQRQESDFEIAQKEQFLRATINMLPEDKKVSFEALFAAMSAGDVGLSDSIRNVLKAAPPRKFFTAAEVKQMLVKSGFDFSKYTANPLSSVHAALKRLKPEEAEMNQIDGVMAWRWAKRPTVSLAPNTEKYLRQLRNKRTPIVDLMAALKESLAQLDGTKTKENFSQEIEKEAARAREIKRRERER